MSALASSDWAKMNQVNQVPFHFYDCIISHSNFWGINCEGSKIANYTAIDANILVGDIRHAENYAIDLKHITIKKQYFHFLMR